MMLVSLIRYIDKCNLHLIISKFSFGLKIIQIALFQYLKRFKSPPLSSGCNSQHLCGVDSANPCTLFCVPDSAFLMLLIEE